jgi:hypothetical protein
MENISMEKNRFFLFATSFAASLIIIVTTTNTPAFSQSVTSDSLKKETTEKTIDGMMNVSSSLIKDSFIPITFWQEKNYSITFVPAYFQINRIYDDPEVKGKDLKNWAAGLGGGYAFSEKLLFYGILAFQNIKGTLSGKMYEDPLPVIDVDTNYRSFFFSPGAGYKLFSSKWISLPLYFGPFIMHYKLDVEMPRESSGGNSLEVSASGSEMVYGFSGGFAISFMILDKLKVTPYYLYMRSFNKPHADADITFTTSFPTTTTTKHTESLDTENLNSSMIGLSATMISSKNISVSASIGGYITSETSWYNEKFLNGLKMKSIVIAVTYTNSHSKEE